MSKAEISIEPIHTACKNCVYANYENITQTGCHLGYIDKFRSKGLEIIEAYDDDKEFYVVNNKKCIGYRINEWFTSRKLDNLSLAEKINRHFETNYIKYTLLINLTNFDSELKIDLLSQELSRLTIKPANIIFIRFQGKNLDLHDIDHIQKILNECKFTDIKWRIQTMLDDNLTDDGLIYECVKSIEKRFLAVITNVPLQINSIIETANTLVSEEMEHFNLISNSDKSAIIFPVSTYKYFLYQLKQDLLKQNDLYHII